MFRFLITLFFLLFLKTSKAQKLEADSSIIRKPISIIWTKVNQQDIKQIYTATVIDYSDKPFTMRQFNESFLSLYRGSFEVLHQSTPKKYHIFLPLFQTLASGLYFIPLTHEEGHRSVLSNLNIGSVSAPFFKNGVAKVSGVLDNSLKKLRDTDLPSYIRLHTAGIESDYMLSQQEEQLVMFEQEKMRNIWGDYYIRKFGLIFYMFSGGFSKKNNIEKEEANELERDIVGDDVLGAIRHLHRPTMAFKRYTSHQDLTQEEQHYIRKVGYLSLLNLVSPIWIKKSTLSINNKFKIGLSTGYLLAPFGDMIEENFYFKKGNNLNMRVFLRQFGNKENYFWGGGLTLSDYQLDKKCLLNLTAQVWNQPNDLSFISTEGVFGGSTEAKISYLMLSTKKSPLKWISMDLSLRAKSQGFIPQDPSLAKTVNIAFGISICPK